MLLLLCFPSCYRQLVHKVSKRLQELEHAAIDSHVYLSLAEPFSEFMP